MKTYFQNLIRDIKSTWESIKYIQHNTFYDIGTTYLQWQVLRMLSKKYPMGDVYEPLDELSQRRYDKQMKRVTQRIMNEKFEEDDWDY